MTLYVHRAERADRLVDALGEVMAEPLADPFAAEVVAVPAKGIERWLTQQLSRRLGRRAGRSDGICAGVRLPVAEPPVRRTAGRRRARPVGARQPGLAAAGRHRQRGRRGVVRGARHPPRGRGRREPSSCTGAGAGTRWPAGWPGCSTGTPPSAPACWRTGPPAATPTASARRCRRTWPGSRSCGGGPAPGSPAPTRSSARWPPRPTGGAALPERISLFGPTRLPAAHLELVAALARHRDVHLWLPHPSPALWARIERRRRAGGDPAERGPDDPHAGTPVAVVPGPGRPRAAAGAVGPTVRRRAPPGRGGARDAAGAAAGRPARRPPPAVAARRWRRTTAASRCTPVTARAGRWTCCARCSSGCWPPTRRSSPATSW